MPLKKVQIVCLHCNTEKYITDNSYRNRPTKFCCYQCSADYKKDRFINKWLNENANGVSENSKTGLISNRVVDWFKENIHNCEECGQSKSWNGKELVLEIDHINGDRTNNFKSNLRYLCPNCHSQTPTFRAKNIKKYNG